MNISFDANQKNSWEYFESSEEKSNDIEEGQIIEISESSDVEENDQKETTDLKVSYIPVQQIQMKLVRSIALNEFNHGQLDNE